MNKCAVCFACLSLLCMACDRSADENPSKFQRQANLKKYSQKAQSAARVNRERFKPLPVPAAPDLSGLKNETPLPDVSALRQWFERERVKAERQAFHEYGANMAGQIDLLMEKYHAQAVKWASQSHPSSDFAAYFQELLQAQERDLQAFASRQAALGRLRPGDEFVERFEGKFKEKRDEWLSSVRWYYGDKAASSCRPDLDVAARDWTDALLSAANDEELEEKFRSVFLRLEEQVQKSVGEKGDPFGVASKEETERLRAELISRQQELEKHIESLYGKDGVLAARRLFGGYLRHWEETLGAEARLSRKKRDLAYFYEDYKERLLALQSQWNAKYLPRESAETR